MVRWTGKWAEKEIDRAAQRLGGEKQFRRKKKVEKAVREAGVYTHKGTAARIDGVEAPAPASAKRTLPGLAPPGGHDDHDAPQIVAPEDAVCSSERARLAAEPAPVAATAPRSRPAPIADAGGARRPRRRWPMGCTSRRRARIARTDSARSCSLRSGPSPRRLPRPPPQTQCRHRSTSTRPWPPPSGVSPSERRTPSASRPPSRQRRLGSVRCACAAAQTCAPR